MYSSTLTKIGLALGFAIGSVATAQDPSPSDRAKIEAGRALFFDKRVSVDGTTSCASCHDMAHGTSDGRKIAVGLIGSRNAPTGIIGNVHSPPVLNTAAAPFVSTPKFWDLRAKNMLEQAVGPIANPKEMGDQTVQQVANRLGQIQGYRALMQQAYGTPQVTKDRIAVSLVSFEATLVAIDTPLTRYLNGDKEAMSRAAKRGAAIFVGRGGCIECHPKPYYTTGLAANTGIEARSNGNNTGLQLTTKKPEHARAFKIPGLVGVQRRLPLAHNGSVPDVRTYLEHYNAGGAFIRNGQVVKDNLIDPRIKPLGLTPQELRDLETCIVEGLEPYDYPRNVEPRQLPQ